MCALDSVPGTGTETYPLIRTKFERPRLRHNFVPRLRLFSLLDYGLDRKLVISALVGATKCALRSEATKNPSCTQPILGHNRDSSLPHGRSE
jgi:hypothetical protein